MKQITCIEDLRVIAHRKVKYRFRFAGSGHRGCFIAFAAGLRAATIATLAGCEVVLCSKIGYEPWGKLEACGIQPNGEHAMEPIEDAVLAMYKEMGSAGKLAGKPAEPASPRMAA